jgi:sulfonate transport system substrate-binding protein
MNKQISTSFLRIPMRTPWQRTLTVIGSIFSVATLLTACAAPAAAPSSAASSANSQPAEASSEKIQLRIGYQRGGEYWNLLKQQRTLEEKFGDEVEITWSLFTSGPPMLEALNAGAIDIGQVGETPPIFAQAAGAPLLYVAQQASDGSGSGILVLPNSPVQTLADLKGKKVAFTKASSANLLIIRALQKEGLSFNDIEPAYLQPPEARAALEGGSADAWVVWNPFYEGAIQELNARILVDGASVSPTNGFVIASQPFVEAHPEIIDTIVLELQAAQQWSADNLEEFGALLEQETEVPASVWIGSFERDQPEVRYIDEEAVVAQQAVADIFYELELIPEQLSIADVAWYGLADD